MGDRGLSTEILNTHPQLEGVLNSIRDMQRTIAELKQSNRELQLFKESLLEIIQVRGGL